MGAAGADRRGAGHAGTALLEAAREKRWRPGEGVGSWGKRADGIDVLRSGGPEDGRTLITSRGPKDNAYCH